MLPLSVLYMAKKYSKEDAPKAKINKDSIKRASRLFTYGKQHNWKYFTGFLFLLLTSATALLFPALMGKLVDAAKVKDISTANYFGIILLIVLLAQSVFSYFRIYLFVSYTENTLANLRQQLYAHIIKLPMAYFAQKRVGELNSRLSSDVVMVQDTLTTTIAEFTRQFILIIGGIVLLGFISAQLTILMLSIVPVVAIAAVFFGRFIRKFSREVQDKVAEANTIVEETLQGIANVKAFTNEVFENMRYKKSTLEIVEKATKGGVFRGAFASFIIFCIFGSIIAVVWYGVLLTIQNNLSIGELISFVLYSVFVGASIGGIAELYAQIQRTIGATQRIFEILEESNENVDMDENAPVTKIAGNVDLKSISFAYPGRKEMQVLKSVTLSASAGETIAIVGPSGSGKSTLASLMLRFYDIDSGEILIDNKSIKSYSLTDLRKNIAIVPQDVLLFGGSILENIAYGKPNATFDEIAAAAKKANAFDFITSFPEQFETKVGERGIQLSGGQRQRIAIARAVLKNPSILILDEATSSLDSESERLVQEALDKLMVGRTSLVIAHRLSTIRNADKIIVIDKGTVKETGKHSELMHNKEGLYYNLTQLQLSFN